MKRTKKILSVVLSTVMLLTCVNVVFPLFGSALSATTAQINAVNTSMANGQTWKAMNELWAIVASIAESNNVNNTTFTMDASGDTGRVTSSNLMKAYLNNKGLNASTLIDALVIADGVRDRTNRNPITAVANGHPQVTVGTQ